jgi:hypothetical protein
MNASGPDPSLSRTTFWGLFLALVLVRVPYFLTHHNQEDAYIAFRTAFNLADHGVYEHAPGATSLLFGFLEAGLRLIFGGWAIGAILIASTIMVVGAAWLLRRRVDAAGPLARLPLGRRGADADRALNQLIPGWRQRSWLQLWRSPSTGSARAGAGPGSGCSCYR